MNLPSEKQQHATEAELLEKVLIQGDLSGLNAQQKTEYYIRVCESLGLNPFTKPFDYLKLSGKEVLYAKRDAADQLRKLHNISAKLSPGQTIENVYVVTAHVSMPSGRTDESNGAVSIQGLRGDALANAMMKAETKAKRRATLSICGLGMLDESEIETIPMAEATVASAPKQLTIEDTKKLLAEKIHAACEAKGLERNLWPKVEDAMKGKTMRDVEAVIAKIVKDNEIPF